MDPTFKETYSMLHWHYSKPLSQNIVLWAIVENKRRCEQSYVNILFLYKNKLSPLCSSFTWGGSNLWCTGSCHSNSRNKIHEIWKTSIVKWISVSDVKDIALVNLTYSVCRTHAMNKAFKVSNACVELGRLTSHHVGIQATKN